MQVFLKGPRKNLSDVATFKHRPKSKEGAIRKRLGEGLPGRKKCKWNEGWMEHRGRDGVLGGEMTERGRGPVFRPWSHAKGCVILDGFSWIQLRG